MWLFLALVLLFLAFLTSRKISVVPALAAGIILVFFRAGPAFISQDYVSTIIGKTVTISGTISKDPEESNGKYNLKLTNLKLQTESQNIPIEGILFTQVTNDDLQRSDIVTISGELSAGFGSYVATIYRPEIKEINRPEPGDVFLKIRNFFADKIRQYIPSPQSGLALGYLLGQKSGVDKTIAETLQLIGLTHIIVASGAHLSTLTGFARKLFGKLSRFASFLVAISATLLFIGITGLSASMLRAGLVTGLSLLLWYFGREIHPLRLIVLVAAVTIIYDPFYITDLAWLLSFLSFSAILVLAPAIVKFLYGKDRKPNFLFSTLISSLAAALLTLPVLLYYFGQISLISVFANLLILPTVSIAMGLTFLTGIFALFLPHLATLFGSLATIILSYQITVANFFGEQKVFLLSIDQNNTLVFLLYLPLIVVIFTTLIYKKLKHKKSLKNSQNKMSMLAPDD
ncbi:ComEC/Rec2 family competence protein [Candidatus Saccharibacteria bacterium]|nr:ComEC/Rec2 family competence protein [Candidatus Saccharibacteria bacterium]